MLNHEEFEEVNDMEEMAALDIHKTVFVEDPDAPGCRGFSSRGALMVGNLNTRSNRGDSCVQEQSASSSGLGSGGQTHGYR